MHDYTESGCLTALLQESFERKRSGTSVYYMHSRLA